MTPIEQPEVKGYLTESALHWTLESAAFGGRDYQPLMTIEQHERIVAALQSMQGEAVFEVVHGPIREDGNPKWVVFESLGDAGIENFPAGTLLYTQPQSPAADWIEGSPEIGHHAILHIPLLRYEDFCAIGCVSETGWIEDMCGDDLGFSAKDVKRWTNLPAMLSASQQGDSQ